MERALATATAIAELRAASESNQEQTAAIAEKVDAGFAALTASLKEIGNTLSQHGLSLQSLTESRTRTRSWVKWVGSIAATVIAALALVWLKVR